MKTLLGVCLLFLAVSCSKDKNDDTNANPNTADVYIKVNIEGTEFKFTGDRTGNEKGCGFVPDGGNTRFRLVGYDGIQYINFWIKTPINTITTTSYTYTDATSLDWNLTGYNVSGNQLRSGSSTFSINSITNGRHSGTITGSVKIEQTGSTKTVPVTGEFKNVQIFQ
jgi:hypothetical protein